MTTNTAQGAMPTARTDAADFRLEMLNLLPCGCVVAVQRLALAGVRVVSLEAKGPHCPFLEHRANKIIRLGEPPELEPDDDESCPDEGLRVA